MYVFREPFSKIFKNHKQQSKIAVLRHFCAPPTIKTRKTERKHTFCFTYIHMYLYILYTYQILSKVWQQGHILRWHAIKQIVCNGQYLYIYICLYVYIYV